MENPLKVARAKKGMSVNELSDRLNVSRQKVWKLENRKIDPKAHTIMRLHCILDIPLDDLVEFFSEKNKEE